MLVTKKYMEYVNQATGISYQDVHCCIEAADQFLYVFFSSASEKLIKWNSTAHHLNITYNTVYDYAISIQYSAKVCIKMFPTIIQMQRYNNLLQLKIIRTYLQSRTRQPMPLHAFAY